MTPLSLITGKVWQATALSAVAFGVWQTNRIEGWIFLNGLEQDVTDCTEARAADATAFQEALHAEVTAHDQTKTNYIEAQEQSRFRQIASAIQTEARQERITSNVSSSYHRRIAELDRQLLELAGDRSDLERLSGGAAVPGVSDAAGGVAAATDDLGTTERVTCIRQAIQLDELINWVEEQGGSDRFYDIGVTMPDAPMHSAGDETDPDDRGALAADQVQGW